MKIIVNEMEIMISEMEIIVMVINHNYEEFFINSQETRDATGNRKLNSRNNSVRRTSKQCK